MLLVVDYVLGEYIVSIHTDTISFVLSNEMDATDVLIAFDEDSTVKIKTDKGVITRQQGGKYTLDNICIGNDLERVSLWFLIYKFRYAIKISDQMEVDYKCKFAIGDLVRCEFITKGPCDEGLIRRLLRSMV
jgi:hypothetical protein